VATAEELVLNDSFTQKLHPKAPFNFAGTFHKPSHFPTPIMIYQDNLFWQTVRFDGRLVGIKLQNVGDLSSPALRFFVFSADNIAHSECVGLIDEIKWRFGLDEDLIEFVNSFKEDDLLETVFRKWLGMRMSCFYSLYELVTITILLQNATVGRTTKMLQRLLDRYGKEVIFDQRVMYAFWNPHDLAEVSENDLRSLGVGYRAKYLHSISQVFAKGELNEKALRKLSNDEIKRELRNLKGIGPASSQIILVECFRRYDALEIIPPWESKIYSMLLCGRIDVPSDQLSRMLLNRWSVWRALAMHYLFEDLFWKRKTEPVSWLEPMIRM